MNLHEIRKLKGANKKKKRRGRGAASGKGAHTTGSGMKGQKSRSGNSLPFGFEGGQVPLYKKLPKIGGFRNPTKKDIVGVSISSLNSFKEGDTVEPKDLVKKNIIRKVPKHGVKLLANGEIKTKLTLNGFMASETALAKLEKAGCKLQN